mmetsp:Transcript_18401/g.28222  ORF Transcript_18401/g.28222 Transcript_18401/m.28222 type:complete len:93 (-) Transcript_18401:462-740(-)
MALKKEELKQKLKADLPMKKKGTFLKRMASSVKEEDKEDNSDDSDHEAKHHNAKMKKYMRLERTMLNEDVEKIKLEKKLKDKKAAKKRFTEN